MRVHEDTLQLTEIERNSKSKWRKENEKGQKNLLIWKFTLS
jgi:hypothetical protein